MTTITRPQASASFTSEFDAQKVIKSETFVSEKGNVITKIERANDRHLVSGGDLSLFQTNNPKVIIFKNSIGKVANIGEDCTIDLTGLIIGKDKKKGIYVN